MQAFVDFAESLLCGALLISFSIALAGSPWALVVVRARTLPPGDVLVQRSLALMSAGALALAFCQAGVLALKAIALSGYLGADAYRSFAGTVQFRAGVAQGLLAVALAV